ncbi:two-component regulator propeller domain-containing protein [Sphingobacterium sp. 40-24]|uniref:ligand-binding sensor domain-containing protein n=1 Tax=Sphingobacterium sp. 40-24 TaxID=1895843 RepID=UPI00095D16F8|nr:two-component regulator propeller domain-containing protein [Sphingobacterium sp. 40-24]OJZ00056.1 MAG: hypothetical protein BGP15_00185 [Sphingobacterium sp. 40-24]
MQSLYFYWLLVCSFVGTAVFGQSLDYPSFRNISLGTNANTVHSFAQDSLGMLWLGSNNGLFNYDGYALQPLTGTKSPFQTFVYCIALIDNKYFALGTGQGVLLYNYQFDRFESFPTGGPVDVRSLLLVGDTLWIGSISGLYCYNTKTRKLIDYQNSFPKNKSKTAVYALEKVGDRILIGTYNGLFELNPSKKDIVPLPLPDYRPGSNQFVNSIFSIPESASTYVGTEYGLYRYNTKNHTLQKTPVLQNHPIKAMASKDSNTLLVGTDDGLFT